MFKKTTKMFLSAFFVFLFTKSSLSNDNLDEEEDYEDEDKDIEGEENEYGSEEESYETVEYTDLNRTFVNLLNQSLPSPTFEMLKPKGFRLTLPEIPKNISEVEYKGVLFKDPFVQHNDTSLNITGLYSYEGKKWFYDNTDIQFDDGDILSIFTYYKYSEPYVFRNYTEVRYIDRMAIKSSRFSIYVPTNGTPPYYIQHKVM